MIKIIYAVARSECDDTCAVRQCGEQPQRNKEVASGGNRPRNDIIYSTYPAGFRSFKFN